MGKRLIKWAAESNSHTFHLVICFTLFPQGALHLTDTQLRANNQLSRQICRDSAVALCSAFSHFQWIFPPDKKLAVTEAFVDNNIVAHGRNNKSHLLWIVINWNWLSIATFSKITKSIICKSLSDIHASCRNTEMSLIIGTRRGVVEVGVYMHGKSKSDSHSRSHWVFSVKRMCHNTSWWRAISTTWGPKKKQWLFQELS